MSETNHPLIKYVRYTNKYQVDTEDTVASFSVDIEICICINPEK